MDNTVEVLKENGFTYSDRIIGRTSKLGKRGAEIKEWIDEHKNEIHSYAVIDDEVIDICGSYGRGVQARYIVECDMNEGMSDNDVDRVIGILTINNVDL